MTLFCSFPCWMNRLRAATQVCRCSLAGGYESGSYKAVHEVLEGLPLVLWALFSCTFWVSWKSSKKIHLLLYLSFSNLKCAKSCSTTVQCQPNKCRENSLCTDVAVLCNQQSFCKRNWFSSSGLNYKMLGKEEQLTGGCSQAHNIYSL